MFLGLAIVLVVFFLVINFFQKRNSGSVGVPGASVTGSLVQNITPTSAAAKDTVIPTKKIQPTPTVVPTEKLNPTRVPVLSITPLPLPNKDGTATTVNYVVKRGDSLWKIATAQLGSGYKWVAIQKLNKIQNPGKLAVGQQLQLPQVEKQQVITQNRGPHPIEGNEYIVVKGDSLSNIALRAYGDSFAWTKIFEANRSLIKNHNLIYSGWKLTIPR